MKEEGGAQGGGRGWAGGSDGLNYRGWEEGRETARAGGFRQGPHEGHLLK
ncbi:hypothetical protein BURPS406E_K0478 [Burkholderia pseudomallei 406e]|uniref:Uncharacterized protein n=1 Tax=Burkholderia pseudomallei (strain 1106a) TaxID=357348 RepID=A3NZD5_BURP0|nr:hypothetical protein BURPS668_3432 [Burkholderia pseudomallei 668]ABN90983.1 hypothetical protein BURPS1106A_3469 [Burkholderia pseudomallei 1106a]ABO04509.1 hypothetical protein BMA10247_3316 [Burkholderia mallei NCTC 10247]AFR17361.1 hypothetical protein BPC006_I3516 [Burkholderia pseudomallei BPC006]EBA48564.1 hypothetical protein BURPS305_4253 [Burkholderia pseudomallei 305]EDK54058.1 hypothetical protein BMAFMH_0721 [Burkholderia mallei FMH]EDK59037.1 hypothetical protein BMAJHU_0724 